MSRKHYEMQIQLHAMAKDIVLHALYISTLRKHAYSNILKISPPKTESFQIKILIFFHISAQNIDYGYSLEPPQWGGSNEYPQSTVFEQKKEK